MNTPPSAVPIDPSLLPEFAVSSQTLDWAVILSVEGDLDRTTINDVRREVEKQWQRPGGPLRSGGLLVLDLSRTTFMDTSGLGLICDLHEGRGSEQAAKLVLVVGTRRVARILELAPPPEPIVVITIDDPTRDPEGDRPRVGGGGTAALPFKARGAGRHAPRGHSLGAR